MVVVLRWLMDSLFKMSMAASLPSASPAIEAAVATNGDRTTLGRFEWPIPLILGADSAH